MDRLISRKSVISKFLCVSLFLLSFTLGAAQESIGESLDTEDAEVSGVIGAEGGKLELNDGTYVEFKPGTFTSDTTIAVSTSLTKPEMLKEANELIAENTSEEQLRRSRILDEKFLEITRYTEIRVSSTGLPNDQKLLEGLHFDAHLPTLKPYPFGNLAAAQIHFFSDEDYIGLSGQQYRDAPPTKESASRLINVPLGNAVVLSPPQNSMSVIIIVEGLKDPPPPRDVERERNNN